MKKKIKQHLLLEQLEDRIFLSASPLAVAAGAEHHDGAEPVANDLHHNDPLALATESQIQHTGVPDSGHVKPVEQEQHKAAETTNSQDGAATEQADQGNPDAAATDNGHDNQSGCCQVAEKQPICYGMIDHEKEDQTTSPSRTA